jgi:hypothetical protein
MSGRVMPRPQSAKGRMGMLGFDMVDKGIGAVKQIGTHFPALH